jgi:hypothetical protein
MRSSLPTCSGAPSQAADKVAVDEVLAAVLGFGLCTFFVAAQNGLRLVVNFMHECEAFGGQPNAACLGQPEVEVKVNEGVRGSVGVCTSCIAEGCSRR